MAKAEWGTKRVCLSCGARFYDLGRSPINCPACSATFDVETATRARRARPMPREEVEEEPVAAVADSDEMTDEAVADEVEEDTDTEEETVIEEPAEEEDEDEGHLIEDTGDLGDDDDDVSDVIDEEDLDEDPDAQR